MVSESRDSSRKRAKYTQVACNECKRRKLKCSGGSVCVRCSRDQIPCVYTNRPSSTVQETGKDERANVRFLAVDRQLETLRREIRTLSARVHELESTPASPSLTGLHRILDAPRSPTYVGPTSAEFGLTRKSLSQAGDCAIDDSGDLSTTAPSPAPSDRGENALGHSLGVDETLRLVQVYEDTVGVIYPCVDLDGVRAYVLEFYRSQASTTASSSVLSMQTASDQDWFSARDVQVLKILLATALLVESHGCSERAAQLADSVEDRFASRLKIAEVDMKEILILTLLSIFHSYRDDEVIAGRLIGMAVRGSTELGLHRQETWQKTGGVFPGELEWTWASRLFWCIYVLDRKCAFGTGLPFAIQDSDIDTNLPEPGHSTPYLTCMISHARLSTKIWGLVVGWPNRSQAATTDGCAYLDAQVQQWIHSIPRELRFDPAASGQTDRAMMLQVLLALQANQLRILVYRQNLLSDERIADNVTGASTAVETAKSTVHMLDYFSRVSSIYFQRPEPFNYFLLSALAALFLAVLHAPARFSHACRPEFYTAVDMVRRSATRARTSRRLQKILHSLKQLNLRWEAGRHFGGHPPKAGSKEKEPHSRATSLCSGIWDTTPVSATESAAAHCTPSLHQTSGTTTPQFSSNTFWPMSPGTVDGPQSNVCEDLSSFFEIAGGFYFDPQTGLDSAAGANVALAPPGDTRSPALDAFHAEDEALTRVMAGLL
ncbi:Copper amine oxidase N2/N3-terminal [Penicillium cf. griseofulvum]|uniref:Copper amine oxidase N2/N3-terminal n=1 Tax=Penicillium cf. griseofulvum TaxID=2972120 RepID=A0A9W9N1A0_9EURO|nr:Copper amine oxidase N2/N3-terminal [Penicillium cf. griseofulvum]KAJ5428944.1 Copper amine oxidase N2/N3-terminal [Penicillium cf. griseofulvum]